MFQTRIWRSSKTTNLRIFMCHNVNIIVYIWSPNLVMCAIAKIGGCTQLFIKHNLWGAINFRLHTKYVKYSDTTSEHKSRKLVSHIQFCERSSPAVKARAPTSSTTKLWSNNEKNNRSSFPTPLPSTKLQLCTTLSISITHGQKYNSGPIL